MSKKIVILVVILIIIIGIIFILTSTPSVKTPLEYLKEYPRSIIVYSIAFDNNSLIPRRYTCDGLDISPPLKWRNIPSGTKSIAVILFDPDAPSRCFIHWIIFNIPANLNGLPEDIPKTGEVKYGIQGINDFHRIGYGGPCPPPGERHRYIFVVIALDTTLNLDPGAPISDFLNAIKGHVLAYGVLVGLYSR